jgi:hypothetical protein
MKKALVLWLAALGLFASLIIIAAFSWRTRELAVEQWYEWEKEDKWVKNGFIYDYSWQREVVRQILTPIYPNAIPNLLLSTSYEKVDEQAVPLFTSAARIEETFGNKRLIFTVKELSKSGIMENRRLLYEFDLPQKDQQQIKYIIIMHVVNDANEATAITLLVSDNLTTIMARTHNPTLARPLETPMIPKEMFTDVTANFKHFEW